MFALGDWAAFLFDFEEWAVCVFACGGAVTFDACLAEGTRVRKRKLIEEKHNKNSPGIFLVVDENLHESRYEA